MVNGRLEDCFRASLSSNPLFLFCGVSRFTQPEICLFPRFSSVLDAQRFDLIFRLSNAPLFLLIYVWHTVYFYNVYFYNRIIIKSNSQNIANVNRAVSTAVKP